MLNTNVQRTNFRRLHKFRCVIHIAVAQTNKTFSIVGLYFFVRTTPQILLPLLQITCLYLHHPCNTILQGQLSRIDDPLYIPFATSLSLCLPSIESTTCHRFFLKKNINYWRFYSRRAIDLAVLPK